MRLGMTLLLCIFALALGGPFCSPATYDAIDLASKNLPPSSLHWFGTDDLGRDLFARSSVGLRISLFIGAAAALIDLVIGTLWGSTAALAGGRIDQMLMRFADLLFSLPYKLVAILLIVALGPGLTSMITALVFIGWITMARIMRGQLMLLKEEPYILTAIGLGASFSRLLFRHLLPNALPTIVVTLSFTISSAIFTEALLSFLGLGLPPPLSSLGTMVHEGLPALRYYPWRFFFPGILITLTIFSLNLIGNAFQEKRL